MIICSTKHYHTALNCYGNIADDEKQNEITIVVV